MVDESDWIQFKLSAETTGFGTRAAGIRLRNTVINLLNRIGSPQRINIDFEGISLVSSSFADEFIGKLVVELGFYRFIKKIRLSNASPTIELILNRSISQRMAEQYIVG